jgi:hypothetical protein
MKSRLTMIRPSAVLIALFLLAASPADAAERRVLAEQFTATWCTNCPDVRAASSLLIDDLGEDLIMYQGHASDGYHLQWAYNRVCYFYGPCAVPDIWFDGLHEILGSAGTVQQNYDAQLALFNERIDEPTDVVINLYAEPLGGQDYRVSIVVRIEPDGVGKNMTLYTMQALDHYPPDSPDYRNCLMHDFPEIIAEVDAGELYAVQFDFTFDNASWAQQQDINLIGWVQPVTWFGPAEVYNAEQVKWPLPEPPDCNSNGVEDFLDIMDGTSLDQNGNGIPDECESACPADVNGDSIVDVLDLLAVLAAWGAAGGPEDINGDGIVNVLDLLEVLGAWGPC